MSDYLPAEMLLGIFHRLPVKSIGRCICVCKYWHSLIKNPNFVATHITETMSLKKDSLFLVKFCSRIDRRVQYSLHFDSKDFGKYAKLGLPFKSDNQSFSIIGSCNGLVCLMHNLYTYNYSIVLWNPLIRKSVTLPNPNVTFETHGAFEVFLGFGFDSRTNDYKVVRVARLLENEDDEKVAVEVEIFSQKGSCWKRVTDRAPQYDIVERSSQAFVNRHVHWVATKRGRDGEFYNLVLAIDMGNEYFHELKLPDCLTYENPMFLAPLVHRGSTIAVSKRNYLGYHDGEIWLMRNYGVEMSWMKLLTVGWHDGSIPRALGFGRNGNVIFELNQGEIVSADPESLEIKDLRIHGVSGYSFLDTFVESLVLLDHPNNATI